MPYVDAFFDRDADIIRCVERRDGKSRFPACMTESTLNWRRHPQIPRTLPCRTEQ